VLDEIGATLLLLADEFDFKACTDQGSFVIAEYFQSGAVRWSAIDDPAELSIDSLPTVEAL
jgi:hypothetical protein